MAWFRRRSLSEEIPELKPYYSDVGEQNRNRWILLFSGLLLAVLIAAGIFFGGRSLYRHYHHPTKAPATATVSTPKKTPSNNTSANSSNSAKNSSSAASSDASKKSSSAVTPPAPSPTPATTAPAATPAVLPNNGPGDIVAIFAGSVILAALLHYTFTTKVKN